MDCNCKVDKSRNRLVISTMDSYSVRTILHLLLFFTAQSSCAEREEVNIVEIWKTTKKNSSPEKWKNNVGICEIREVCHSASEECTAGKIRWENLASLIRNSTQVVIMNDKTFEEATVNYTLKQNDLDELKGHICDLTLIQKHAEGCLILWLPNQCPWENITNEEAFEDTKEGL